MFSDWANRLLYAVQFGYVLHDVTDHNFGIVNLDPADLGILKVNDQIIGKGHEPEKQEDVGPAFLFQH